MVIIQVSLRESFSGSATLLHLHSFTHTVNKFIHTCIQEIVIECLLYVCEYYDEHKKSRKVVSYKHVRWR